jgi:hypothetical protein
LLLIAKRVYRVGVLWPDPSAEAEARPFIRSFIAGLEERGYVEGAISYLSIVSRPRSRRVSQQGSPTS